jgi:hypothetical protein
MVEAENPMATPKMNPNLSEFPVSEAVALADATLVAAADLFEETEAELYEISSST